MSKHLTTAEAIRRLKKEIKVFMRELLLNAYEDRVWLSSAVIGFIVGSLITNIINGG